ncbi:hypothetical protein Pchl3084_2857 [Pseudomonas chlororaphis subsp. aureofaciens 30-84]|nr:hypothetical protein Pchl3084_2857 [Pseudomonas chlororaphis subsp. aureofaciens 30-84]
MGTTKTSGKYWRHGPGGTMVKAFKLRDWFGQESHGAPPVAAAEPARLRSTAQRSQAGRRALPGTPQAQVLRQLRCRSQPRAARQRLPRFPVAAAAGCDRGRRTRYQP